MINIEPTAADAPSGPIVGGTPAAYAQHRFEQERDRDRLKSRAVLPVFISVGVIAITAVFFGLQGLGIPIASLASVVTGLAFLFALLRLPAESLLWAKGVEGERKAAEYLEPLLGKGYVVLYGRLIPGMNADIDSIVIGPTGIFVIETKNWSGKLNVVNDRLLVGDHDRTWVVDQVYRGAVATQIALGEELNVARITVTPVLCAIGGVARRSGTPGGVHVVDGRGLAQLVTERPVVLDDDLIQRLARLADRRLRQPMAWEAGIK